MNLNEVKLDVCWFCYRATGATALVNVHQMLQYTREQGVDIRMERYGNSLIHHSRNNALAHLRPDFTHMLMLDDDMLCEQDAVLKLLELESPVATPITTNRRPPIHLIPHIWEEKLQSYLPITRLNLHKAVRGYFAVGAAFLLFDRYTVRALINDYLAANDWLRENSRVLDRMVVKGDHRERERARRSAIRMQKFDKDGAVRIFKFPVDDEERELSEDFAIGDTLRALGIESVVDGTVRIGHVGEYPFGVWDLMHREELQQAIAEDSDFDPRQWMSPNVCRFFDDYLKDATPKEEQAA